MSCNLIWWLKRKWINWSYQIHESVWRVHIGRIFVSDQETLFEKRRRRRTRKYGDRRHHQTSEKKLRKSDHALSNIHIQGYTTKKNHETWDQSDSWERSTSRSKRIENRRPSLRREIEKKKTGREEYRRKEEKERKRKH